MNDVAIIGLFCFGENVSNGQSVKTRIVSQEIARVYGEENIWEIDTYRWKRKPSRLFARCVKAVLKYRNVLFLTDEGGIKVFPRLLRWANVAGRCKIHYYVVGGWLSNYLDSSSSAKRNLQKLDAIYVEISAMEKELEDRGFQNIVLVNKFRRITPVVLEDIELNQAAPYKLCYFSRVMKEKGIEEAIAAVKLANSRAGFEKYHLDIYGSIFEPYEENFQQMMREFPSFIHYGGVVDYRMSGEVLKKYFAMLFPTYYASEGYPNAIVDAFAAGLPVIATRWNYNVDIIQDHQDGILVEVGNVEHLVAAIEELSKTSEKYAEMRLNCLARCSEYLPEAAVAKVIDRMK